jgi:hypothetical protein
MADGFNEKMRCVPPDRVGIVAASEMEHGLNREARLRNGVAFEDRTNLPIAMARSM